VTVSSHTAHYTLALAAMSLIAIKYGPEGLQLLDQRLLPFETVYLPVPDPQAAWQHIKDMVVRGAPAIGVTGALALAAHLRKGGMGKQYNGNVQTAVEDVCSTMDYLVTRCGALLGFRSVCAWPLMI